MTIKEKTGVRDLTFSGWIRKNLPDSKRGTVKRAVESGTVEYHDEDCGYWVPHSEVLKLSNNSDKLQAENKRLRECIDDFLDYFNPKGGISDVPLGPFERTKETLDDLTKNKE